VKLRKCTVAAFFAAGSLFASRFASAQERLPPEYYPRSVRGAVLAYSDIHGIRLAATASVPADGSFCKPPPPLAPSPGALPPFSVVKVLDQRSFFWTDPTNSYGGPVDRCLWAWANFKPHIDTWYRIVAIDETGVPKRTTDGQMIEGWADAGEFQAVADPFATVKAVKQREGERWCPAGARKFTAIFGTIWDSNTGQKLPSLGPGKPIDILGPTWPPGYSGNQLCLARVESTGQTVMIDATSASQ
jgi:hypothetical protein